MVRIGFVDNTSYSNFTQFDVIKHDCADSTSSLVEHANLGVTATNATNRLKVDLEFDFLDRSTLTSLKNVTLNSTRPLIFMKHPSGSDQLYDFQGSPSHAVVTADSESEDLAYGGTPIATFAYLNQFPNGSIIPLDYAQDAHSYGYIFFKFVTTYDFSAPLQRITLAMYSPYCYMGSVASGFKIDAYDQLNNKWIELNRCNFTLAPYTISDTAYSSKYNWWFASIRPTKDFSNFVNFALSNEIYFRMRNTRPRPLTSIHYMGMGYTYLMIDGFPVSLLSNNAFNFRDSFTGTGYTGTMSLQEI